MPTEPRAPYGAQCTRTNISYKPYTSIGGKRYFCPNSLSTCCSTYETSNQSNRERKQPSFSSDIPHNLAGFLPDLESTIDQPTSIPLIVHTSKTHQKFPVELCQTHMALTITMMHLAETPILAFQKLPRLLLSRQCTCRLIPWHCNQQTDGTAGSDSDTRYSVLFYFIR
jgi:hypothetical protein